MSRVVIRTWPHEGTVQGRRRACCPPTREAVERAGEFVAWIIENPQIPPDVRDAHAHDAALDSPSRRTMPGSTEVYTGKRTRLAVEQPRCFIERQRSLPEA
jgi:hypothetical protein